MDYSSLREAGLTEGEVKVYLALLRLGNSTSGKIVKEARVSRSIIYHILEKLIEKGLVSYILKDKTKYFQAADPVKIRAYIEEKEKEFDKTKRDIEDLLPNLLSLKESSKKSVAQIYEGFTGIQAAHEHTYLKLKKGEEYFYLGIPAFQDEKYHLYWERDHKRRIKARINCKLLFNQGTDKKILKNRNGFKGCEARYMPVDVKTPAWFMGYKDVVLIGLQSEKGIAIEIVDEKIAGSFRAYFEEFWEKSRKTK